jgi:hypothetical protein
MKIKHDTDILIGDFQFADTFNKEVLSLIKSETFSISKDVTNVKAWHTDWVWQSENFNIIKFKTFLIHEIEKFFNPGVRIDGDRFFLEFHNFWANVYYKGDYANSHDHRPYDFSFAYFVKTKWYDSPLIFTDSGKRIRPKEGRFVVFPGYIKHHVPKHRYNDTRITLSGNLAVKIP